MKIFNTFIQTGLIHSLETIGEEASIGGNQFVAAFSESTMDVMRNVFGDSDEVTTKATCLLSALTNRPRINETLIRINERKTYVITEVNSDAGSYIMTLRAKDA